MAPTLSAKYNNILVKFWNYSFGTAYAKDHKFTESELLTITPELVYAYSAFKTYGIPNPGVDDFPTEGRSSSIEFSKKAISFFMPNQLAHWDVRTKSGNPTKSVQVNDLIKAVKKAEVRKQGVASSACRPLTVN